MRPLFAIFVPTYGMVSIQWANARAEMQLPLNGTAVYSFDPSGKNIAEKRNAAVNWARSIGAKYLFFLGDDILPPADTLIKMLRLQTLGYRVITGMYYGRSIPLQPMIFNDYLRGPDWDWHIGDLKQVKVAGCDCLMIDAKVFDEIEPPWFSLDYQMIESKKTFCRNTEDFYFFAKLFQAGIKAWCDTSIQCGHQDRESQIIYALPPDYPQAKPGSEIPRNQDILIADIGAGLRSDPLYLTGDVVRFDIDPARKPDVLCDALAIPEPDCKFDLVLASHILEHIGMWQTVDAIREWVRILKVGGKLVIRIPNILYAFKQIIDGAYQPFHFQMIYGAQHAIGEFHRNGFTKSTLTKLGEMFSDHLRVDSVDYTGSTDYEETEITLIATKYKHYEKPILTEVFKDGNDDSAGGIVSVGGA